MILIDLVTIVILYLLLFLSFKALISVSLALIIEASLEAYFQFWLQSNYSLPDILAIDFKTGQNIMEQVVTYRTISILLSFITITVSIVKIRFVFSSS